MPATQSPAVAMVLHEMITNSIKYGALGVANGSAELSWSVDPHDDGFDLDVRWRERGGPLVEPKPTPGVGTTLIEGLTRADLRGEVNFGFHREGVDHTLRFRIAA